MVWADREINLVLYADYGRIAGRYHEGIQDAMVGSVGIFRRMGIDANLQKTNSMVCTHGFIWGKWG